MTSRTAWTAEETKALIRGVKKHGEGNWINIIRDPVLAPKLQNRTNINLKDKWRNLKRYLDKTDYTMTPKGETTTSSSGSTVEAKEKFQEYEAVIYEALAFSEDARGSDITTIADYIEEHYEVPDDFTGQLEVEVMKLVEKNEVEEEDDEGFYRMVFPDY